MTSDELKRFIAAFANEFSEPIRDRADATVRRIIVTLRLATEHKLDPTDEQIQDELDVVLKLAPENGAVSRLEDRVRRTDERRPVTADDPLDSGKVSHTPVSGEIYVESVLPFLLLGPLSRSGYLEALAANLDAVELSALSPVFAAALAYKVLDPPERGWRRRSSSIAAAAAFAAVSHPIDDSDIEKFERELSGHLSPMDVALAGPLIEGHDASQPLLVIRAGDGILLLDVDGLFPLAWMPELENVRSIVKNFDGALLLIPEEIADPRSLGKLNEASLSFVTDAAPTRGEYWREVRRSSNRWWTNNSSRDDSHLVKIARRLENSSIEASELWRMLSVERGIRRSDEPSDLDRHLTLTAANALGTIAWKLWRGREEPIPQLTLQRFRDMDGRIIFSEDAVRVVLPLGRRREDLLEHGLLEDVRDVPWLGGRVVQFSGG